MIILTNDPSVTAWGWAVVQLAGSRARILETGCIKTKPEYKKRKIRKSDDKVRRFVVISKKLVEIHEEYDLDWVLSELPHGSQSASASIMIGAVGGILAAFSASFGLPIEWYSEGDCKKHLLGKRSCTKQEIIDEISNIYGTAWRREVKYKDQAVADAVAVFHAGRDSSQALIFAANQ